MSTTRRPPRVSQYPAGEIPTPVEISDISLAFPADALTYMPEWEDIPEVFRETRTPWHQLATTWFIHGLSKHYSGFVPREGIDPAVAIKQLSAIQGSYAPKHQHKEASVAWLCSLWFEWVAYGRYGAKSKSTEVEFIDPDGAGPELAREWLEQQKKAEGADA